MQSQDLHKTEGWKTESADTMRDIWHPLWGGMGPSRQEAKHMHWHCYRHPQASRWLPASAANEPSHLTPLLCSLLFHIEEGLSLQRCEPIFHPLTPTILSLHPATLPLHFRNGCGNTSTERTDSFPACQEEQQADFKQQFNSTDIDTKSNLCLEWPGSFAA